MIYTYRCKDCAKKMTAARTVDTRHAVPECACGGETRLIIVPVEINDYFLGSEKNPGYKCPVTEEWVTSKRQRHRIMDEHDLIEKG